MTRKDELLHGAKAAIDAGENFLHVAAEKIAEAAEQGATQRQIATAVGKSAAWVKCAARQARRILIQLGAQPNGTD
jgi:Ni,Fe-hydrogenase I small subunit